MKRKGFDYDIQVQSPEASSLSFRKMVDVRVHLSNFLDIPDIPFDRQMANSFAALFGEEQAFGSNAEAVAMLGDQRHVGCRFEAEKKTGPTGLDGFVSESESQLEESGLRLLADQEFKRLDLSFRRCTVSSGYPISSVVHLLEARTNSLNVTLRKYAKNPPSTSNTDLLIAEVKFLDQKVVATYKTCAAPIRQQALAIITRYLGTG